ncbi:Malate synthase, glyoxysomal [Linum grandiflorum]
MLGYATYGNSASRNDKKIIAGGAYDAPEGVDIRGSYDEKFAKILTKDALQFVADLQRELRNRIRFALDCRSEAKAKYNAGGLPGFDPATRFIRESDWSCAPLPEAKIWNCVFEKAEKIVGIERGSIRATVLIETLPAVFQMNEILYELRDHSTFQSHPDRLLPDRFQVGMTQHFMRSYSDLLISTCHRRGAAQIPIRDDPEANEAAVELVRKDKLREVKAGHDGTWAAHPGLIPACMEVFTNIMGNSPNQINTTKREDALGITEEDLLQHPRGVRTMEGLRLNTRVGIQYVAAWLTGTGSVPLYNLMEDAATAEISRVQNWQWIRYGVELDGDGLGVKVNKEVLWKVVEEEMARIQREVGKDKFNKGMYKVASRIFTRQCTAEKLDDFLTLDAYNHIVVHYPMAAASRL